MIDSAVKNAFINTKPSLPSQITLDTIIIRLIIIDQIDSTSLSKNFGTGGYQALARSIFNANLEDKIAHHQPISNPDFQSIAIRKSVSGGKNGKFFSIVTKYIAKTASLCYGYDDGYPIYDGVLHNHLHLYINALTKTKMENIRQTCDYEKYCLEINNFLSNLNNKLAPTNKITNLMFDHIVWFSYKKPNAPQKYN